MSLKILIALAIKFNWHLHHIDILTAFLNAELREYILIELPETI